MITIRDVSTEAEISVILPTYNSIAFLKLAVASILNQTYQQFELMIIDDASTDKTYDFLKSISDRRVKIVKNAKRLGVARSLNKAILKTPTKYIARMDADDISDSRRLEKQYRFLKNNPNVGVLGSGVRLVDSSGKSWGHINPPVNHKEIKKELFKKNIMIHPTIMFKKDLFLKFGGYDEKLDGAEDYDLWLRLAQKTKLHNLPECLLSWRRNPNAVSYQDLDRIQFNALKARLKAMRIYKYSWKNSFHLLPLLLSLAIPVELKKLLYKYKYHYA